MVYININIKSLKSKNHMGAQYTSSIADAAVDGTMVGSHLNSPDDIRGLPYFPTGTKSLLSKCLTADIWN